MKKIALDYFSNLFKFSEPKEIEGVTDLLEQKVTGEKNDFLLRPVTK